MNRIVLRLRVDGGSEWIGNDGAVHEGWPIPGRDDRVEVLVPAADVLLLEIALIPGSERHWSRALPFLVEDQLVLPVESQHVAWARAGDDARLCVAVVERARLDGWLARLRAAGVEPDAMFSEALALPWHGERPTLLVDGGRCVLRLAETGALAGEADEIASLMPPGDAAIAVDAWLVGEASTSVPVHSRRIVGHALHVLAAQPPAPGLNLLQGEYAPRRRSEGLARHWRRAAVLVATAVLLALLHPLLDHHKLGRLVIAQRAEMEQLYRRAVPSAGAVDAPARRLRSALVARGLDRGEGAMALLAQAAPAIAADDRLSLDALEYREHRLDLVLRGGSVADLDALRQRLSRAGLAAEITGTTPGTRGVQGRLRLAAAP